MLLQAPDDDQGLRDYAAARDWLYALKNRGTTYGIDRMRLFAEELGQPQLAYPVIHVAGTNGKGSTAAMLEALFRASGYRTGLSTSPHLVRQGERIQIDRRILSEEAILGYTRELKARAEAIADARGPEWHPSFFEFMTAMAFLHFQRARVDVAIVEVGLGGRLDATNVVDPEVSVITSIGLDHCEILGRTHAAIAREKAGIVKPGKPTILGRLPAEAEAAIAGICRERAAPLVRLADAWGEDPARYPETSLHGECQRRNAALAMTVARNLQDRFDLDLERCRRSLLEVNWPGRWEERTLPGGRKIVFDVSHNAEGAIWLERNLAELRQRTGAAPDVVMGVLGEYRAKALVPAAARNARSLRFVIPAQSRSCIFEMLEACTPAGFQGPVLRAEVAALFPAKGVCALDGPASAPPLVVTGSIYLLGEVWDRFLEESPLGQGALQDF